MEADLDKHAMIMAADAARSRRTDDVRRRSKHHIDVMENSTQTECLDPSTNMSWSRDWFLWKQTTMLCSVTFTLLLGTLTQIKQIMSVGNAHRHYGLLVCILLCSLLLQCSVVFLLLIITTKETNWLQDYSNGSLTTRRTITIAMALVFVIALLKICEFVLMN